MVVQRQVIETVHDPAPLISSTQAALKCHEVAIFTEAGALSGTDRSLLTGSEVESTVRKYSLR